MVGPSVGTEGGARGGGRWWNEGFGGLGEEASGGCLKLVVVKGAMVGTWARVGGRGVWWFDCFGGLAAIEEQVGMVAKAAEGVDCEWEEHNVVSAEGFEILRVGDVS